MENPGRAVISSHRDFLSWRLRLCYGVGHILNDICSSIWFTYSIIFFHVVLNFDNVSSGMIVLIGQVADAISTPFVGIESDRDNDSWLCKFGKRKSWHLFGTVCILGSFPFIYTPCLGCKDAHIYAQMIYYSAFVTIFQFGWASVQISHLALIPELTPDDHQRTQLNAIRYCFTVISTILIYVIAWISLSSNKDSSHFEQIGPDDAFYFQRVVYIGLLIGVLASCAFYFGVKEESAVERKNRKRNHKTAIQFMKDIKFYQVALTYMSSRLFVNLVQLNIPLYLHETLSESAEKIAVIPLLIYLGSVATSTFIHYLNRALGRKVWRSREISYIIGAMIGLIACIWIKLGHNQQYEIYPIAILLGISGSILIVTSLGLTADLIGFDTDTGAFVYSCMSFTDKLSNGIAVMAIQYTRCSSCNDFYQNVLVYVCGGVAVAGILPFLMLKTSVSGDSRVNADEVKSLL